MTRPALQAVKKPIRLAPAATARLTAEQRAFRVQATAVLSANAGGAQTIAARYGIDAAEIVGATNGTACPAVGCNQTVNLLFDDIANAGVYRCPPGICVPGDTCGYEVAPVTRANPAGSWASRTSPPAAS